MSFARISELLDTKNRQPKETNELTELIQDHVSENVTKDLGPKIEHLESKIDSIREHLESKIDSIREHLESKIDSKIEHLEFKIDSKIEHLESKIDATNQRIDSVDKSNRWIIGLLIGFGTSMMGMLINIWLSMGK